jgi:hypothetical protein
MEPRKRNDPFNPAPKGRPVTGTPAQLAFLDALQPPNYEVLPTGYVHKLFGYQYGRDLIRLLNGEGYIRIPLGARILDARNKKTCWELTDKGELLLAKYGRYNGAARGDDQFGHKYLRSIVQFSFDRASKEISGLRRRSIEEILAHENCPPATRQDAAEGKNPSWIPLSDHFIKPDAPLFGYEYTQPGGKKRYFYLHGFEADRGTEPLTGYKRQTIQAKVRNYAKYLAGGYRARYGLSNCAIPFVATTASRARGILEVIEEEAPDLASKFLAKVIPAFDSTSPVPPPTGHMLTEDWLQVGGKTLNILSILRGGDTVDARHQNTPREGVGSPA